MWPTAVLARALVRPATVPTNVAPIATGGNGGDGGGEGGGGEGEGGGGEGGGWACCSSRRWLGTRGIGDGIRTGGGGGIGGRASDMSGSVIVSVIVRLEVVAASLTGASTKNGAGVAARRTKNSSPTSSDKGRETQPHLSRCEWGLPSPGKRRGREGHVVGVMRSGELGRSR